MLLLFYVCPRNGQIVFRHFDFFNHKYVVICFAKLMFEMDEARRLRKLYFEG